MLKFEHTDIMNFDNAIRGMRNPLNSWDKSDSRFENGDPYNVFVFGQNDLNLAQRLIRAGSDHRKFMRQILVSVDITAPLYWWKEFDTYKVGTVANSCSTMHKIHSKPIEMSDFSFDNPYEEKKDDKLFWSTFNECLIDMVENCECLRNKFVETNDKRYWRALIQILPESYNQKRTVTMSYENLLHMYRSRKNHKLTEWSVDFMNWISMLPYSNELIKCE